MVTSKHTNGRYDELAARIDRLDAKIDHAISAFRAEYVEGHATLGNRVDAGFTQLKDQLLEFYTRGPVVDACSKIAALEREVVNLPDEFVRKLELVPVLASVADHEKALASVKKMFWVVIAPAVMVGLKAAYDILISIMKHIRPI